MRCHRFVITVLLGVVFLMSVPAAYSLTEEEKLMQEHTPRLSVEQVLHMAKAYAKEKGRIEEKYFVSSVAYDSLRKTWDVFFMGKLPMPGNHFSVMIEDRTGKTELYPGQ